MAGPSSPTPGTRRCQNLLPDLHHVRSRPLPRGAALRSRLCHRPSGADPTPSQAAGPRKAEDGGNAAHTQQARPRSPGSRPPPTPSGPRGPGAPAVGLAAPVPSRPCAERAPSLLCGSASSAPTAAGTWEPALSHGAPHRRAGEGGGEPSCSGGSEENATGALLRYGGRALRGEGPRGRAKEPAQAGKSAGGA